MFADLLGLLRRLAVLSLHRALLLPHQRQHRVLVPSFEFVAAPGFLESQAQPIDACWHQSTRRQRWLAVPLAVPDLEWLAFCLG